MKRTLTTICIAALALGTGCLGDDPDHIPTTGYGGLGKIPSGPVTPSSGQVLHALLIANLHVDYAGEASGPIAAPELCGDCAVTIDRALLGAIVDLTVRDDTGTELCHIAGTSDSLTVDTCGLFDR